MFRRISSVAFHNRRVVAPGRLQSVRSESSSSSDDPKLPAESKPKLPGKEESKSVTKPRDRHIIVGPDNVPYDPSEDPYYTTEISHFRYPQYFTKDLGNKRTWRAVKNDIELMKKGRIHPTREELPCPPQVDVCIFGGGIIGSAIAYFIKDRAPFSLSVGVIERDPTYTRASSTLSVGGIRQQFSLPENILMSMYGAEFLRNAKRNLSILNSEPPDISFTPQGFLTLADASQAEELMANHKLQIELGALVELFDAERIKEKFPMINTDGVVLGSYGVQNEGWFDPWALLLSLKAKAMCLGAEYIHADVLDFNFKLPVNPHGAVLEQLPTCHHVVIREPDGNTRQVEFAFGVICAGYNSPFLASKLGYGRNFATGLKFPIEPRKRYVYAFNSKDGPGLNFPFLIENCLYCRREGLGGNFICGDSPSEGDEPDVDDLDVDYSFFENQIGPKLAHRVPSLKNAKLKGAWAGFYDYNSYDQSPIIGRDPFFDNLIWATGFGGHGIQMAPAVGRAVMEIVVDNRYKTIDLSRFGWDRIRQNKPLQEAYSY